MVWLVVTGYDGGWGIGRSAIRHSKKKASVDVTEVEAKSCCWTKKKKKKNNKRGLTAQSRSLVGYRQEVKVRHYERRCAVIIREHKIGVQQRRGRRRSRAAIAK
jgi:hypothetical protein